MLFLSIMTNPKKELNVACNYFLRLIKNHVQLTNEQINLFKRVFHEILWKRFVDHWFPGKSFASSVDLIQFFQQHLIVEVLIDVFKPNIGKIQYSNPLLNVLVCHFIAIYPPCSLCGLVTHPSILLLILYRLHFSDPGEVAVCFGDEGTWCSLYKDDHDGQIHQEYSDGEETTSSLSSDDDLVKNVDGNDSSLPSKSLITEPQHSLYFNAISSTVNNCKQSMNELNSFSINWNEQEESGYFPLTSESLLFFNQ